MMTLNVFQYKYLHPIADVSQEVAKVKVSAFIWLIMLPGCLISWYI
jgi:hypothetical protein